MSSVSPDELLMRAAVLSVFDVGWIHPQLTDDEADDVVDFLSSSCERVVDATGTPRWQLRDDERIRVLRDAPPDSLHAAMNSVAARPDDPVQVALEQFLSGSLPPLDQLDATGLRGVLQVERWVGEDPRLPAPSDIQARLNWMTLVGPLQRLVAHGFVGRQDLLAKLRSFIEREPPPKAQSNVFLIEGTGGCGKSTALAKLILDLPAQDDLAVYISFDRGWLIGGGPWAVFDEIVRQVGMQLTERRPDANELRQQAHELAGRAPGYSDIASRGSRRGVPVSRGRLRSLAALLPDSGRLVVVLDTLEELTRRHEGLANEFFDFLTKLSDVRQVRVIAAGRSLPTAALDSGHLWHLKGLSDADALQLLRTLTAGTQTSDELLDGVVRLARGNPLSLHLAADLLNRPPDDPAQPIGDDPAQLIGGDPAQLITVAEGILQGLLYSRILEHIRDRQVRAIAHPGLVVRRLTPGIICEVLAKPCGLAPLDEDDAADIFAKLRAEATLCEPSPDGDRALVHRQDVRTLMLPSIQQDSPGTTRAVHEAAVRYYEAAPEESGIRVRATVARREELYHRLMLNQEWPTLDQRWDPTVAYDLTIVIDELPPRAQLYLNTKVQGLRLDPAVRAEADDDEWRQAVRPTAMLLMQRGKVTEALQLVQERRGSDGHALLPDLEIEALERLNRGKEALSLVRKERQRASRRGAVEQVRLLISQEARILERMRRWSEARALLDGLAGLDRDRRARTATLDDEVRVRELTVLTSILRIARKRRPWYTRIRGALARILGVARHPRTLPTVWRQWRAHRPTDKVTRETVDLAEATPKRLLTANPSLLRDLAAEIGSSSPEILQLAVSALDAPAGGIAGPYAGVTSATDISTEALEEARSELVAPDADQEVSGWSTEFRVVSDASQRYRRRRRRPRPALFSRLPKLFWRSSADEPWPGDWPVVREQHLEEYPALAADLAVWLTQVEPRFRRLDHRAQILQNQFWRQHLALITGGLVATSLGVIQAAMGGGVPAVAVAQAMVAGVLAGLTVLMGSRHAQRGYLTARLAAEQIKSEFFRFLAREGTYATDDPVARLMERIGAIEATEDAT
jgi:hypothetical protein